MCKYRLIQYSCSGPSESPSHEKPQYIPKYCITNPYDRPCLPAVICGHNKLLRFVQCTDFNLDCPPSSLGYEVVQFGIREGMCDACKQAKNHLLERFGAIICEMDQIGARMMTTNYVELMELLGRLQNLMPALRKAVSDESAFMDYHMRVWSYPVESIRQRKEEMDLVWTRLESSMADAASKLDCGRQQLGYPCYLSHT